MKYILALDQGTTSSRAIVFNEAGATVGMAQQEFMQMFPQPGWVEHNPTEIWQTQYGVALQAISNAGITRADIAAIGITNQRETTVVWDRRTGEPIHNAIVWQDRRTADFCDGLKARSLDPWIRKKTGLVIDAYFSASKIHWILKNVAGARELAEAGHLAFGTIDSWLIWNLSGGKAHVTDVSNASRTMLLHIRRAKWDNSLLKLFEVPKSMLPKLVGSSEVVAHATKELEGIPIAGIAGDQQAALFGQVCTRPGMVEKYLRHRLLHAHAHRARTALLAQETDFDHCLANQRQSGICAEGSIFIGGAVRSMDARRPWDYQVVQGIEPVAPLCRTRAVFMCPAFAGLGAPHWEPHARGIIVGLTRGGTAIRGISRAPCRKHRVSNSRPGSGDGKRFRPADCASCASMAALRE